MTEMNEESGISFLFFFVSVTSWEFIRQRQTRKLFEKAYWGERKGRIRVEQEMKRLTDVQLNSKEGFFVQPIGLIESCYRQCVGTPRQGLLVPSSRALLVLGNNISPDAFDGLEDFSHVWLTFKFHLNTNTLKEAKAFAGPKYTFSAKVTPPMLKQKKGVFSTRSPHRPNPFGVTLARLDGVYKESRALLLGACDLVNGTPVLDVKPYVPVYDTVPGGTHRIPEWISETVFTRNVVTVSDEARAEARALVRCMRVYRKDLLKPLSKTERRALLRNDMDESFLFLEQEFWSGLIETLAADVRSEFQTKKVVETEGQNFGELPFDGVLVKTEWTDARTILVTAVVEVPPPPEQLGDFGGSEEQDAVLTAAEELVFATITTRNS